MAQPYKILSVGGSIIIPKTGFDITFLKKFRDIILAEVKKKQKFILVAGGGATCRTYQAAAKQFGDVKTVDLDWIGIKTTLANAELLRVIFKNYSYPEVVTNPTKKVTTSKPIIIAAGWKPGCSTDKDAVLLAKTYGAKEMINLSNVDYVYESDPRENPSAKMFETITWKEFRKIVGTKWVPGANVPFDPMAAGQAEKMGLTVRFARGTDLRAVERVITKGDGVGTLIVP